MTADYADIVEELRLLAKAVLERAEPVLKLVAASSPPGAEIVRALESVVNGEKTDFADELTANGSKIIAQIRGFIEDVAPVAKDAGATPTATDESETVARHALPDTEPVGEPVNH